MERGSPERRSAVGRTPAALLQVGIILAGVVFAGLACAGEAWRAEVPGEGPALVSLDGVPAVAGGRLVATCGEERLAGVVVTSKGQVRSPEEVISRRDSLLVWVPAQRGAQQWARPARRHIGLAITEGTAPAAIGLGAAAAGRPEPLTWRRDEVSSGVTFLEKLPPLRAADDPWFWVRLMSAQGAEEATVTAHAPGATGEGVAQLTLRFFLPAPLAGRSVEVSARGQRVATLSLPGERFATETVELPAKALAGGELDLTLRLLSPPGATGLVQAFLDEVEIAYQSLPVARDGSLVVPLDAVHGAFEASGFSVKHLQGGIRTADGRFHWLVLPRARKGKGGFALRLPDPAGALVAAGLDPAGARLVLFGGEPDAAAELVPRTAAPDLGAKPGVGRPLILVAAEPLHERLRPLAKLRATQGWRPVIVDPAEAYLGRGDGSESPEAIRAWLAERLGEGVDTDGIPHVVLVGAASYDPDHHLGEQNAKPGPFVPCFLVDSRHMVTGSDTAFGDLDHDGIPEIAVGRIPAADAAELGAYLAKVLPWEDGATPRQLRRALFVADAEDVQAGLDFGAVARELAALMPRGVETALVDQDAAKGRGAFAADIGAQIAAGVDWVTYVGHGSITTWGRGSAIGVAGAAELAGLGAGRRPAVFVALDCLNAYHVHPSLRSFAETFLFAPSGGASAFAGSTTLAGSSSTFTTARLLGASLADDGAPGSLGELMLAVRRALAADPSMREMQETWILLGDPSQAAPRPPR